MHGTSLVLVSQGNSVDLVYIDWGCFGLGWIGLDRITDTRRSRLPVFII